MTMVVGQESDRPRVWKSGGGNTVQFGVRGCGDLPMGAAVWVGFCPRDSMTTEGESLAGQHRSNTEGPKILHLSNHKMAAGETGGGDLGAASLPLMLNIR